MLKLGFNVVPFSKKDIDHDRMRLYMNSVKHRQRKQTTRPCHCSPLQSDAGYTNTDYTDRNISCLSVGLVVYNEKCLNSWSLIAQTSPNSKDNNSLTEAWKNYNTGTVILPKQNQTRDDSRTLIEADERRRKVKLKKKRTFLCFFSNGLLLLFFSFFECLQAG